MIDLLAILTPIALIDSLSLIPVAVVPMLLLLGGARPLAGSMAFIAGIVATYLPFGVLLLFGLDGLFDSLAEHFQKWWASEPDLGELILQILIGLALIALGYRVCARRGKKAVEKSGPGMTPGQAFTLAAIINVSGLWGALPYFAAIAQILKEDLPSTGMMTALLFYNLVFILPLLAFPATHWILGARAERFFFRLKELVDRWVGRILVTLLIGLGFLLVVDGVGWLLGRPLILAGDPG